MFGEKAEELADVAAIGFQGFSGHAPFGAEIAEPAADFGGDVGTGGGAGHGVNLALLPYPSLNRRNRTDLSA